MESFGAYQIKATVIDPCSKVINCLRENKSGLQTKIEDSHHQLWEENKGSFHWSEQKQTQRSFW